jgi:hypothetical protein
MQKTNRSIHAKAGMPAIGILSVIMCATAAVAASVPQPKALPIHTALPVQFMHTVDASKVRPDGTVAAKTLQAVVLPDGESLPKGSLVIGHVVNARPFQFDTTPYAHQQPSEISIHFDRIESGSLSVPVNLSVRALAKTIESEEAARPHYLDEMDAVGTMEMIGGYEYTPLDKMIQDENGDAIGYIRKQGVFARLLPAGSCDGTDTEQSVAIFSPTACGLYGFTDLRMPHSGRRGSGTFTLASPRRSVRLYAGSTALLEETDAR